MPQIIKKLLCETMVLCGLARAGRLRNRSKLLVVMYHGVSRLPHVDPIWTQLPVERFERQLDFLQRWYCPVTLAQVLRVLRGKEKLPPRAVLLTFDDGLRNNYTVAWPILRARKIPATVFLTVDYIGGHRLLWPDELYLLVKNAHEHAQALPEPFADLCLQTESVWPRYALLVEALKRMGDDQRQQAMDALRRTIPLPDHALCEDFTLLNWQEVDTMHRDGLIDFGVHTASHTILSRIAPGDLEKEIVRPKKNLEKKLGHEVEAFCYPNGRSGIDFHEEHKTRLRQAGYACAFTTDHGLHAMGTDPFAIKRIAAGNDMTSDPAFFQLACSGII